MQSSMTMIGGVMNSGECVKRQEPENLHLDYKDKRNCLLPRGRGGGGIDRQKRAED